MYLLVQKFAENFPPFLRENLWWAALIKVKKKPAQIEVRQFPKQTIEVSLIIVFFIFSTNPIVFYKTPVTNKQTRIVIIYKILSLFFVAKINYNWCRKITKTDLKNLSWLVKLFVKTSDFFVVSSFNERKKIQTCKNWGQTVSKADVVLKFSRIFQPIQLTPVIRPSFNYISWTEGRFWGQLLFTKPSKLELFLYTKFWVCFLWLW